MATSAAAGGLARRHLGGRCRGGPAADRDRVRQRRGALSRPVHARLDVASQRRDRGGRRAAGHRRSELPAEPGRARQGRRPDRGPPDRPLRQRQGREARHQHRHARAAAQDSGNRRCARRRNHRLPARLRRVSCADGTEIRDGAGHEHLQGAREVADRQLNPLPWWTFAALLASWSAGIVIATLMSPLIPWLVLGVLLAAGVVLINRHLAPLIGLAFLALLLGAGRGVLAPTVELPTSLADQTVAVSGMVDDDPVAHKGNRRLTVRLDHVLGGAGQTTSRLRILATVYGATSVHYGDLVLLSGEIVAPPRFDQFDYRTYLAEQGIAGVMPSARLVRVTAHPGDPLHRLLCAIRHAVINTVDRALPGPQAALLLGVVFGYRAALPPALEQQMIASGLVHIVVASGLNIALLARLVQQALGRMGPRGAAVTALIAIIGYALLSGASPAALRATLMGGLVILGGMIHRQSHVLVALSLASALLLGIKPSLVRDVGFQLSFA